jgi:glucan phosphoethanolaminetransferase (alkaline phosphatase superfamily)
MRRELPFALLWVLIAQAFLALTIVCWNRAHSVPLQELGFVAAEYLVFILAWALLDSWLFTRFEQIRLKKVVRLTREAIAVMAFVGGVFAFVDAFCLRSMGQHVVELAQTTALGGDIRSTLREIEFTWGKVIFLTTGVLLLGGIAVLIYRVPRRRFISSGGFAAMWSVVVLSGIAVLAEQSFSRKTFSYSTRSDRYPLYLTMVPPAVPGAHWVSIEFADGDPDVRLHQVLEGVKPAGNPKNVIVLLLESVRTDAISDESVTPNLVHLSQGATWFRGARATAISTALVWNSFFMDRPPYTFDEDARYPERYQEGAPGLEILKKAGYQVYLSISTNTRMKNHERRILGAHPHLDGFYCAYEGEYSGRDQADTRAAETASRWLRSSIDSKRPFFLLVQLEATHWPYEFDESRAKFTGFAPRGKLIFSQDSAQVFALKQRYRNALAEVDHNTGEILKALSERFDLADTVIVAFSDHGEDFRDGALSHLALGQETRSIPWFGRFPGISGRGVKRLATQRDFYPTLFDYLKISNGKEFAQRSLLSESSEPRPMITFSGNLRYADLEYGDTVIRFRVRPSRSRLEFLPIDVQKIDGSEMLSPEETVSGLNWEQALRSALSDF